MEIHRSTLSILIINALIKVIMEATINTLILRTIHIYFFKIYIITSPKIVIINKINTMERVFASKSL
jgi:hypothetical protein